MILAGLTLLILSQASVASAQVVRDFTARFTTNTTGDIRVLGNTMLTCDPALSTDCQDVRDGVGNVATERNNNNEHTMVYVDVDSDPTTFNSSQASFSLPMGANVLWAGLYWGGRTRVGVDGAAAPDETLKDRVKFATPLMAGYSNVTASVCDNAGSDYQCFADVTTLVPTNGDGLYTVGNVQLGTGKNRFGGWGLVVVYNDPASPTRNLVVYDGFANVLRNPNTVVKVDINVSGFLTPVQGDVVSRVGALVYEGDLDASGDSFLLNGQKLSDASNPVDNFFNATNSDAGQQVATKNPNYTNQLGFDLDVVEVTNVLGNNVTNTTVTLETTGDTYFPGVVTFATEIYAPRVLANKTVVDLNGGDAVPGDVLEYTIEVENTGNDPADRIVLEDPIPNGTTYVPGSILIDNVSYSDQPGDDVAEVSNRVLTARLGTGATSVAGGVLNTNDKSIVRFRVTVDGNIASGTSIDNQATVDYRARTLAKDFIVLTDGDRANAGSSPTVIVITGNAPKVSITQPTQGQMVNQSQPAIVGEANPGADVTIVIDGGTPVTVKANANGDWIYVPTNPLSDGQHTVNVSSKNSAGLEATDSVTFTVDSTIPVVLISEPANGSTTNNTKPPITGTTEPNTRVTIVIDGGQSVTVTSDANGYWSFVPPAPLSDGPHTVTATVTDAAGNVSADSSTFLIDTQAPTLNITEPPNRSSTNNARPTIRGKAEPGATITLTIDGGAPITVTADGSGNWDYTVPTDLADGPHVVRATTEDDAGNTATDLTIFTVDTTPPPLTIFTPADGSSTNNKQPNISGTTEPGATVTISIDGGAPVTVQADDNGNWSYTPDTPLAEGSHKVDVTSTDDAGNSKSDSVTFTVDQNAPTLTIESPQNAETVTDRTPTISGKADPGATVKVTVTQTGEELTTTADANGDWSVTPTTRLPNGGNSATATIDGVPNAPVESVTFTVDGQPGLVIISPENGATVDNPPTITGTADPGAEVIVTVDGEEIGRTTADPNGNWTITPDTIPEGDQTITVTSNNPDGSKEVVTVDVTVSAPTAGATQYVVVGGAFCANVPGQQPTTPLALLLIAGLALLVRRRRA